MRELSSRIAKQIIPHQAKKILEEESRKEENVRGALSIEFCFDKNGNVLGVLIHVTGEA